MTILIFLILSFILVNDSHAELYFEDVFTDPMLSRWEKSGTSENSNWQVVDGKLVGYANTDSSSLLHSRWNNSCLVGDYKVESEVENLSGVDQIFFVRVSEDKNDYYQIDYRYNEPAHSVDNNNITICKIVDGQVVGDRIAVYPGDIEKDFDITQNKKHLIGIELIGNKVLVYFDNKLAISYTDEDAPLLCGGVSLLNWGGRCSVPTENSFEFIKVSSVDEESPTGKSKLIFIPGMGASWNTEAMVKGKSDENSAWKMTPFVKNYDGFFDALEDNGMVKNQDFFVWNYDWRQPVAKIVENFDKYVDQKVGNSKFSIVGHSLGGLVGRVWFQDHVGDSRLEKVVSAGSPQYGSLDAYSLWNSGRVLGRDDVASTALNLILALQSNKYCSKIDALRNFVPSVKDILPVFNFAKKDSMEIPYGQMKTINGFLQGKNSNVAGIYDKYISVVGTGKNTYEWIELGKRTTLDALTGKWPDGHPINLINGDGDGTVLVKSANFPDDDYTSVFSGHGDLVSKGGGNILAEVGLGGVVSDQSYPLLGKKIFFIGSPAKISVKCKGSNEVENDDLGFVVVDANTGSCSIKITGTGYGTYHLVYGIAGDDSSFEYIENEITPGEIDVIRPNQNNTYMWKELILREINTMRRRFPANRRLPVIVKYLEKNRIFEVLDELKSFRIETDEKISTEKLIRYAGKILEENAGTMSKNDLRNTIMQERKRFLRIGRESNQISEINALSFDLASQYLDQAAVKLSVNDLKQALADVYLAKSLTLGW